MTKSKKPPKVKPAEEPAPRPGEPIVEVPLDLIDDGPNVRTTLDEDGVAELAESIRSVGVLQPIRVQPTGGGHFKLLWGQRRTAAARLAGLASIPAVVDLRELSPGRRRVEQLIENLQRRDLNPLDEARALREILDEEEGLTIEELAKRLGRSRPWVSNSLRLLQTTPKVQAAIASGTLTASHGRQLAALEAEEQEEALTEIADGGMTSDELEAVLANRRREHELAAQRDNKDRQRAGVILQKLRELGEGATVFVFQNPVVAAELEASGLCLVVREDRAKERAGVWYGDDRGTRPSCGCHAYTADAEYWRDPAAATLIPSCLDPAHVAERTATYQAQEAERDAKYEADRAAEKARRARDKAILAAELEPQLEQLHYGLVRLTLYVLAEEHDLERELLQEFIPGIDDEETERDDALWDAVLLVPDDKIAARTADALAERMALGPWRGGSTTPVRAFIDATFGTEPTKPKSKRSRK